MDGPFDGGMDRVPDPTSEIARRAAGDMRKIVTAHLDASQMGIDAIFLAAVDTVLESVETAVHVPNLPDIDADYVAGLLAAFTYLVRALALQASPIDPESNLRRLLAEFDERDTTY
jgi:hypothetical protein